jgi:hypothetical protein
MGGCPYYQRLVYINTQELPMIPPFGINQSYTNDELVDIMLFGTPPEWLHKMDQMGFNPARSDSVALLRFMENCEAAEILNDAAPGNAAPGWRNIVGNVRDTLGCRNEG